MCTSTWPTLVRGWPGEGGALGDGWAGESNCGNEGSLGVQGYWRAPAVPRPTAPRGFLLQAA